MIYSDLDFNHKTILITGGAGFIGSNIAFYLQNNFPKAKIIVFDCFRNNEFLENGNPISYGHYKNLIGFYGEIICGNINNKIDLSILENFDIDYIFHQAAISDTRAYNQELVLKTNVNSFYSILEIAKKHDSVLVYASSAATYGNLPAPQVEGNENPENPYGYSKLVMDQIAFKYSRENSNMAIVGLRFFNVYGPREFYKAKTASMVIQLGHQILSNKSPGLFRQSDTIFRDFIYIEDVIQANIKACNPQKNGSYNVGTSIPRSFQDIVDILQYEFKTSLKINYFDNPYNGYQLNTQANIDLIEENLSFKPNFTLEEGIKSYLPEIKRLHGEDIL
tara:strand:+ start:2684 stop:3688 length:1005 start_codon:yes stop_codon:yes gene_type:complete